VSEPVAPVSKRISDSIYNGEFVEKYETGIIYKRGEIAGGLAEGEWLTFYRDGKLWSKGNYHNGLRTGYAVSYWPNGQKSSEGYYAEGKMVGNWNEEGKSVAKTFPGTPDTTKYKKIRPR
jgi:antitoxin component YwqK of YwqJK toxin-antitoxin module